MDDPVTPLLADGSAPLSPPDLLARLEGLGIQHRTMTHPAVHTVAEAREKRGAIPGAHSKNLFVRDKKGRMWLFACLEHRRVDLRWLGDQVGARGRLSFASERRLMTYLGITPGAVSPLAVVNDRTGSVEVVLDRGLLERPPVNFHPLENTMTTSLAPEDLLRFLEEEDHPPRILDLDGGG